MTGSKWLPDLGLGAAVALLGVFEVFASGADGATAARGPLLLVSVSIGLAVAGARHAPAAALALVWVVCALQVVNDVAIMLTQLTIAIVSFGTARWGRPATVWLSAISIPIAAVVAIVFVGSGGQVRVLELAGVTAFIEEAYRRGDTWQVGAALVGLAALGLPWLAGLALRFSVRARRSEVSQVAAEAERDQAEEVARLREQQARLARDVHDVVGHSLAVILAQAESAQYLPDAGTAALKTTMASIATTARTSLQDVRQVLSSTNGTASAPARHGGLDSLVDGVRAGGHDVVSTEVGTPQPLPPELDGVAFRVLQEMLTNAIKHGRRAETILVERHWEGELRIEVRNVIDTGAQDTQPIALAEPVVEHAGRGLDGMRRRLESVGGRLDVRRRAEAAGPTFTATAWLPVRSGAP